jgi:hypothetical protein
VLPSFLAEEPRASAAALGPSLVIRPPAEVGAASLRPPEEPPAERAASARSLEALPAERVASARLLAELAAGPVASPRLPGEPGAIAVPAVDHQMTALAPVPAKRGRSRSRSQR